MRRGSRDTRSSRRRAGADSEAPSCSSFRPSRARTTSRRTTRSAAPVGTRRSCGSPSPAFDQTRGVPGGITSFSPARTSRSSPPMRKRAAPPRISNRSSGFGWTCSAAAKPPGLTKNSMRTSSPFVSAAVSRKTTRSPVTGCSISCPRSPPRPGSTPRGAWAGRGFEPGMGSPRTVAERSVPRRFARAPAAGLRRSGPASAGC